MIEDVFMLLSTVPTHTVPMFCNEEHLVNRICWQSVAIEDHVRWVLDGALIETRDESRRECKSGGMGLSVRTRTHLMRALDRQTVACAVSFNLWFHPCERDVRDNLRGVGRGEVCLQFASCGAVLLLLHYIARDGYIDIYIFNTTAGFDFALFNATVWCL
eukprot:779149-Amphidinium_carterae.1